MKENSVIETCTICAQTESSGIHILTVFICENCERKIVSSDVNDQFYKHYLQQLKKLKHSLVNIS